MHLESLTSNSKRLWPKLKAFPQFVLAGGTALALQIGHRISVDFDFFSDKEISNSLLSAIQKEFDDSSVKLLIKNRDELTISVSGVNLSFIFYPFPVVRPLKKFQGVRMLSVSEIAATKAYTLGRRAAYKDYVDLYYILAEKHINLRGLLSLAHRKYKHDFDTRLFLEQLLYLEDVKDVRIEFLKKSVVTKRMLESFFEREVKKIKL